jgi:hypothetical protein
MSIRQPTIAAMFAMTACGRVGFDASFDAPPGSAFDASSGDTAVPSDIRVVPSDAVIPIDGLAICMRPAPFLRYITVVASDNGRTQTVAYCYAGLTGQLDAEIRRDGSGSSRFAETNVPVEAGMASFFIGSADCVGCYVRLDADGLRDEGPIIDFISD